LRHTWGIAAGSAACAVGSATAAAGLPGTAVTVLELCIPLSYSVPPVRIKERGWLGVAADALAAHVYPAGLALLAVSHWTGRPVTTTLTAAALAWAGAVGVRGILSHQLVTADDDLDAGLRTVAHHVGPRLERFVIVAVLPVEVGAFALALTSAGTGIVLWTFVALYLLYELVKMASGRFEVSVFRSGGQRYVPFVEESFYKVWGPIVLALDAARVAPLYLIVVPLFALLFPDLLRGEYGRLRQTAAALAVMRARVPVARSSGEG
jgi:hypothetical protein